MGLFGDIGKTLGNVVTEHWDDVLVGVASGVGFAFGGPVGAALVGGAASAVQDGVKEGWGWHNFEAAGTGALSGMFGGALGLGGIGGKLLTKGGLVLAKDSLVEGSQGVAKGYGKDFLAGGWKTLGLRTAVPAGWKGAQAGLPKTLRGMLGTTVPSLVRPGMEEYAKLNAPKPVPIIDISKQELSFDA